MSLPWQQGYSQAQAFREALGIGNRTLASWRALLEALGLDSRCRCPSFPPMGSFEGLAGPSQAGSPVIIVSGQASAASQRFAFCRALSGFLDSGWSLATTSHSARQKRNRAFAAELLAPADMIREEIREGIVGSETVERVAAKFGVSEYVVGHQIENHGIAELYVGAR